MPERILIFDTTLRDGEQAPGFSMTPAEKLELARQIEALGVDVIEAGFPIASDGDFAGVAAVAQACRTVQVAALARTVDADVRRAARALEAAARPRLHLFLATSDIHLQHKLRKTRAEVLADTASAVALARTFTADVEFSPEDATRSDRAFLAAVCEAAIAAGARTMNIPDTVGFTVPTEFASLIAWLRGHVRGAHDTVWSAHCHNDLGLAVANSLAAVAAGARQIECTLNGIGERAGNTALEEFAMALYVRGDALPFATGLRLHQLQPSSELLSRITGIGVQPNKAIVGANAFAHEAGIHQDGMLKSPLTYAIMTPATVGRDGHAFVLGKHSGRHALAHRLQQLGYTLDRSRLQQIYAEFLALADQQKSISDGDLRALVERTVSPASAPPASVLRAAS
ncbi:MAG: 2-isopropylmalate synthase [Terriglobales bacterium]